MEPIFIIALLEAISLLVSRKLDSNYDDLLFNSHSFLTADKQAFYSSKIPVWKKYLPFYNVYCYYQKTHMLEKEYESVGINPYHLSEIIEYVHLQEQRKKQELQSIKRTGAYEYTQKFGEKEEKWIAIKPGIDTIQMNIKNIHLYMGVNSFITEDIVYLKESDKIQISYFKNKMKLEQTAIHADVPMVVHLVAKDNKNYQIEMKGRYQLFYREKENEEYEPVEEESFHQKQKTFQIK